MRELKATGYTVGTTFNIEVTQSAQLCNGGEFRLITCKAFPALTAVLPVTIILNGTVYPVLDQFGNTLQSDQIRARRCYQLVFGTHSPHFMIRQCLPRSQATPQEV